LALVEAINALIAHVTSSLRNEATESAASAGSEARPRD
jgi:hypothetical protein